MLLSVGRLLSRQFCLRFSADPKMSAQTTAVVCDFDVQTTGCARRRQAEPQTTARGGLSDRGQAQTTALVCACAWTGLRQHVAGTRVAVCTSWQPQTIALLRLEMSQQSYTGGGALGPPLSPGGKSWCTNVRAPTGGAPAPPEPTGRRPAPFHQLWPGRGCATELVHECPCTNQLRWGHPLRPAQRRLGYDGRVSPMPCPLP